MAVLCTGILCAGVAHGQLKKQFFVEDSKEFDKVNLSMKVDFGACHLKATEHPGVFSLYSKHGSERFSHSYSKEVNDRVCDLQLSLQESNPGQLGQSISNNIFGDRSYREESNFWKAFLTVDKVYDIKLDYGVGMANLDLSKLSVEKLKIHTGSADINIGYFDGLYNKVEMDTFHVKVDLGNVTVKNLSHARSDNVIADVGFGSLYLDLSETPKKQSTIVGTVGAGTLMILIPEEDTPIKVSISESWLCRVSLPDSFSKISGNTYVNKEYKEDADNLLTFDLDVSMGSLIFQEK